MGVILLEETESNMMQLFFSSLQPLTFLSLFIFTLVPGLEAKEGGTTIGSTAEYCALNSTHTMCMYTGASASGSSKTLFRGLSEASKSAFLDKHNELRSKVANGLQAGQPAAANMMKLKWNTELEAIAQRLADQCIFKHDKVRLKLDGTVSGQNVYIKKSSTQQRQNWDADLSTSWKIMNTKTWSSATTLFLVISGINLCTFQVRPVPAAPRGQPAQTDSAWLRSTAWLRGTVHLVTINGP